MAEITSRESTIGSILIRLLLVLIAAAAMTSSVFAVYSCQFFSYRALDDEPWEELTPPFDNLAEASVGLFRYSEVTTAEENFLFGDACIMYEDWTEIGQQVYFLVAQCASLIAPFVALLAVANIFFELLCCRVKGSYFLTRMFFFLAFALQGCSFMIFLDTQYCFDAASQNQCRIRTGGWYSLGSAVAYLWLAIFVVSMGPFKDSGIVRMGCCVWTGKTVASRAARAQDGDTDEDDGAADAQGVYGDEENQPMMSARSQSTADWEPIIDPSLVKSASVEPEVEEVVPMESPEEPVMDSPRVSEDPPADEEEKEEPDWEEKEEPEVEQQEQNQPLVVSESVDQSPDFLDMCCAGDPLELAPERKRGGKVNANDNASLAQNSLIETSHEQA